MQGSNVRCIKLATSGPCILVLVHWEPALWPWAGHLASQSLHFVIFYDFVIFFVRAVLGSEKKLRGRYRDVSYPPCPEACQPPQFSTPAPRPPRRQSDTFVTIGEPKLMHHYHLKCGNKKKISEGVRNSRQSTEDFNGSKKIFLYWYYHSEYMSLYIHLS